MEHGTFLRALRLGSGSSLLHDQQQRILGPPLSRSLSLARSAKIMHYLYY